MRKGEFVSREISPCPQRSAAASRPRLPLRFNGDWWHLRPNAGELSRAASRWVACRTHRLTLRRPLPNHRMLDGFPGSWRCGGIIGNVTDGPKSGIPIAADPATVERSGFAIGLKAGFLSIAWGNRRWFGNQSEKPLAWLRDQPGWTPLLLRIVRLSRNLKDAGKVRRAVRAQASVFAFLRGARCNGPVTP